jgi:DNA recombination protein RmuC
VLVTARRFGELGVTSDDLDAPRQVEEAPRALSAPELAAPDLSALGDVARPGAAVLDAPLTDPEAGREPGRGDRDRGERGVDRRGA